MNSREAATPEPNKKLQTNNIHTFIFPNTGSENEFPLAATPADKKLIYNKIYSIC